MLRFDWCHDYSSILGKFWESLSSGNLKQNHLCMVIVNLYIEIHDSFIDLISGSIFTMILIMIMIIMIIF